MYRIIQRLIYSIIIIVSFQPLCSGGEENNNVENNVNIDLQLGAIEQLNAVKKNTDLIDLMHFLTEAPIPKDPGPVPPYNQQPPDAQKDFRVVPPPDGSPPVDEPGTPIDQPELPESPTDMPTTDEPMQPQEPPTEEPPDMKPKPKPGQKVPIQ